VGSQRFNAFDPEWWSDDGGASPSYKLRRLPPSEAAAASLPMPVEKPGVHRARQDRLAPELRAAGHPGAVRVLELLADGSVGSRALRRVVDHDRTPIDPEALVMLTLAGLVIGSDPVGLSPRGREVWMAIRGLV
jgi:hypothetical protein